jgi:hypothetical protein
MKLIHVLFLGAAILGTLYVVHMMRSHQGQSILPGVGIG